VCTSGGKHGDWLTGLPCGAAGSPSDRLCDVVSLSSPKNQIPVSATCQKNQLGFKGKTSVKVLHQI